MRFLQRRLGRVPGRTDAALVGRRIAERRGLRPGQSFTVAGVTVQVAGVFASDGAGEENVIYTHLPLLLNTEQHRRVPRDAVRGHARRPAAGRRRSARRSTRRSRTSSRCRPRRSRRRPTTRTRWRDLLDLIGMTRWLGFVCVGVVVVLVANSVVMAAQDRVKEHAVLQTLGFSGPRIVVADADRELPHQPGRRRARARSACVGVPGVEADEPLDRGREHRLRRVAGAGWRGAGLSLVVGFVAGAVPAWQAGRAEIVSSLR